MALQPAYVLFMARNGWVSIKEIQELVGHKTITMAARYAHLSPHVTATASERMVAPPEE